jgi:hypothetical protein
LHRLHKVNLYVLRIKVLLKLSIRKLFNTLILSHLPCYHFRIYHSRHICFAQHHLSSVLGGSAHFWCYTHDNLSLDILPNKNTLEGFHLLLLLMHSIECRTCGSYKEVASHNIFKLCMIAFCHSRVYCLWFVLSSSALDTLWFHNLDLYSHQA